MNWDYSRATPPDVDSAVTNMQASIRKIPLVMKQQLREVLDRSERLDVIQMVEKPTDWVSSLVLVKKPNGTV